MMTMVGKTMRRIQEELRAGFHRGSFGRGATNCHRLLEGAETCRVSLKRPQIVQSASRLSRRLSHLRWPQPRARIEMAEVPIVSTPRNLRIDPPPSQSRTLASPFQYYPRQSSDK